MENISFLAASVRECEDCGGRMISKIERQTFDYGVGKDATSLSADVPVWRCESCGEAFLDEAGEMARHDAVCAHLGVMSPTEVRAARGNLSRHEFYELTGIAEASMKRWESGEQIQTRAMDLLLRLAADPVGIHRIRDIVRTRDTTTVSIVTAQFRTELSPEAYLRSGRFRLRRTG